MYIAWRRRLAPRRAAPARRRNDYDIPEAPKRDEANGKAQNERGKARPAEIGQDGGERIRSFDGRNSRTTDRAHSL